MVVGWYAPGAPDAAEHRYRYKDMAEAVRQGGGHAAGRTHVISLITVMLIEKVVHKQIMKHPDTDK